ncbi:MAG: molybdate ABC transporter substrate-binding protein [Bacillota bacterium]|nr:molybdate ABC transporter substrate-binding protein [Bacillota bacterium]
MKRKLLLALSCLLLFGLVGCQGKNDSEKASGEKDGEKMDIIVFAAASLTESMEEIKALYEKENPNVNIIYTFDSSGTLKTQIEEGGKADIFISAAQKQMNALDPEVNADLGDKTIDSASRIDLLENKVCLVVPKGSTKGISSFEDLNTDLVEAIALGNSDVPVGQYSEEILTNLGIWDQIQDKVTYGSNVKEVTTWVAEAVVDCGLIYKTDAYSAGLEVVYEEDGSHLETPVVYPAALVANSEVAEEAGKFLDYLQGPEATEIFEGVGFSPAK